MVRRRRLTSPRCTSCPTRLFLPEFQSRLLSNGHDRRRHGLRLDAGDVGAHRSRRPPAGRRSRRSPSSSSGCSSASGCCATLTPRAWRSRWRRVCRWSTARSSKRSRGMPDDARFEPLGRKQMLRRIGLDRLDPALFERPKSGFVLPFGRWIRTSLGRAMDETMRDQSLAADVGSERLDGRGLWSAFQNDVPGLYWTRVWAIYVLIRWCHRHGCWHDEPMPECSTVPRQRPALLPHHAVPRRGASTRAGRSTASRSRRCPRAVGDRRRRLDRRDAARSSPSTRHGCPTSALIRRAESRPPAASAAASSRPSMRATRPSISAEFDYVCKLDLDLDLPPGYFEGLMERMEAEPRLGTTSGKPWFVHPRTGDLVPEVCGDEMSVGMTKFYRRSASRDRRLRRAGDVGRHRLPPRAHARAGWRRASNDEALRFIHLRPQGASQKSIWTGRRPGRLRPVLHGHRAALLPGQRRASRSRASSARRQHRDAVGLRPSALKRLPRYDDREFRRFLRRYQHACLLRGKRRRRARLNARQEAVWRRSARPSPALARARMTARSLELLGLGFDPGRMDGDCRSAASPGPGAAHDPTSSSPPTPRTCA